MEGTIFKIKRKKLGVSLEFIGKQIGVGKGELSRFENGKREFSNYMINQAYIVLDGSLDLDTSYKQALVDFVKQLYRNVINKQDLNMSFDVFCQSCWKNARDHYYFVWLLGILMYQCFCHLNHDVYDINYLISTLAEYEDLIPYEIKSIYYGTLGVYYQKENHHKSLSYFKSAKSSASNIIEEAFALFQIGKDKCFSNELTEALDCLMNANTIFMNQFCINASILVQVELAFVYAKLGLYENAKRKFNECLKLPKMIPGITIDLSDVMSKLLYCLLDQKDFDEIINYKEDLLLVDSSNSLFLFCIGYAYYHLKDIQNAQKYILSAWRLRDARLKQQHDIIQAYKMIMNGKMFEEYEKKFLSVLDSKEDIHGSQFQIFVLEELIYFSEKERKIDKQLEYYKRLHKMLRKRR